MSQVSIPVTTYLTRENRPGRAYGSPGVLPLWYSETNVFARVSLGRVPPDATITSAVLSLTTASAASGGATVIAAGVTEPWRASVTWSNRPSAGAALDTVTIADPPADAAYDLDVTPWAVGRPRDGLKITTSSTSPVVRLNGSSAADGQPRLVVDYVVTPDTPANLRPDGGAASVEKPTLTYVGDEDMVSQRVQYSLDGGATVAFDTGDAFLPATEGRYVPAAGAPSAAGATVSWRVRVKNGDATSDWSPWADYTYAALPAVAIVSPPAETPDGSPPLQWTATAQESWKVDFYRGTTLLDSSKGWRDNAATRDWTPSRSVPVPGGRGRFVLRVRDGVDRASAAGAPTEAVVEREFVTELAGTAAAVDSLSLSWDGPVAVISGTRDEGVPDEVSLLRDGVQVPLWDSEGDPAMRQPGNEFFSGTAFEVRDYTAPPRGAHTWKVVAWTNGSPSTGNPGVTQTRFEDSVWLVNPRTGEKVAVYGEGDVPTVEQVVTENSVLHVPVSGARVVEPVRRRLVRTTRSGSIEGVVLNADGEVLDAWTAAPSGDKYRLVFGRVNWSVILGDYSPSDKFYDDLQTPDRLGVAMNWWERLADF
jgi:hypothetical protein